MFMVYSLTFVQLFLLIKCTALAPNKSIGDTFRQCLMSQMPANLGHCLGAGAISRLQSLDNSPEFELVDGLTLTKDVQEYRDAHNFGEGDPSNLRSIYDSFSYVFSKRNMKWTMGYLYPGLAMHIAPSGQPGGTLEFILDPRSESVNLHTLKEAGTGRLLARQFLLPLLLGFKFNVVSIIPVLFGILALIAKKALVISKIALVASSAFALGTLLFGSGSISPNQYHTSGQYGHFGQGGHGSHGHGGHGGHGGHVGHLGHLSHLGHNGFHGYTRFPEEEYDDSLFKEANDPVQDSINLYPNVIQSIETEEQRDKKKGRNFAWNEDEKKKKPI